MSRPLSIAILNGPATKRKRLQAGHLSDELDMNVVVVVVKSGRIGGGVIDDSDSDHCATEKLRTLAASLKELPPTDQIIAARFSLVRHIVRVGDKGAVGGPSLRFCARGQLQSRGRPRSATRRLHIQMSGRHLQASVQIR